MHTKDKIKTVAKNKNNNKNIFIVRHKNSYENNDLLPTL